MARRNLQDAPMDVAFLTLAELGRIERRRKRSPAATT